MYEQCVLLFVSYLSHQKNVYKPQTQVNQSTSAAMPENYFKATAKFLQKVN